MSLVSIGEAARILQIRTSAIRYYEERGLVRPAMRKGGKRHYGPDELRRLAFIQLLAQIGVGLDVAEAVLDRPDRAWRARTEDQIRDFDQFIERAAIARDVLEHMLECKSEHPVRQCPTMLALLDRRLSGTSWTALATEHDETPKRRSRRSRKRHPSPRRARIEGTTKNGASAK